MTTRQIQTEVEDFLLSLGYVPDPLAPKVDPVVFDLSFIAAPNPPISAVLWRRGALTLYDYSGRRICESREGRLDENIKTKLREYARHDARTIHKPRRKPA